MIFEGYIERWDEYVSNIKNAKDLYELCEALNDGSDEFDNGSRWEVID